MSTWITHEINARADGKVVATAGGCAGGTRPSPVRAGRRGAAWAREMGG